MTTFETTKITTNGTTFYSLKNRRQRHEILRTLKTIHSLHLSERMFNEGIFKDALSQQTYATPLYENAMNVILCIMIVHNVPTCFVIQQYSSQTNTLHPKHRSEPSIWMVPLSIPAKWKGLLHNSQHHAIVLQGDLIIRDVKYQNVPVRLLLERVLYDGKLRDSMTMAYHMEFLHHWVKYASSKVYGSGIHIQLKPVYSLQTIPARDVHDEVLNEPIHGFRFYSMRQVIAYFHNVAYKSHKLEHLDPFAVHRVRLLPDASQYIKTNANTGDADDVITWESTMEYCAKLADASKTKTDDVYTIAVNMSDPKNTYGVYHVYAPYGTTLPRIGTSGLAILRLETFEQHDELIRATRNNPTIYLRARIHPYFKKWALVSRNFADNIVTRQHENPLGNSGQPMSSANYGNPMNSANSSKPEYKPYHSKYTHKS
jgi:hypothetical protein